MIVVMISRCGSKRDFSNPNDPDNQEEGAVKQSNTEEGAVKQSNAEEGVVKQSNAEEENGQSESLNSESSSDSQSTTVESKSGPHVNITKTIKIESPLQEDEEGDNVMQGAYIQSNGSIVVVKNKVRNTSNGKEYLPMIELSGLSDTTITQVNLEIPDDLNLRYYDTFLEQAIKYNGSIITQGYTPKKRRLTIYDEAGSVQDVQEFAITHLFAKKFFYEENDSLKIISPIHKGILVCDLDFNTQEYFTNCNESPDTNPKIILDEESIGFKAVHGSVFFNDYFYVMVIETNNRLVKFNSNLVFQENFTISKLLMTKEERDTAKIVTDSQNLYFVNLSNDQLIFRQIELVE